MKCAGRSDPEQAANAKLSTSLIVSTSWIVIWEGAACTGQRKEGPRRPFATALGVVALVRLVVSG